MGELSEVAASAASAMGQDGSFLNLGGRTAGQVAILLNTEAERASWAEPQVSAGDAAERLETRRSALAMLATICTSSVNSSRSGNGASLLSWQAFEEIFDTTDAVGALCAHPDAAAELSAGGLTAAAVALEALSRTWQERFAGLLAHTAPLPEPSAGTPLADATDAAAQAADALAAAIGDVLSTSSRVVDSEGTPEVPALIERGALEQRLLLWAKRGFVLDALAALEPPALSPPAAPPAANLSVAPPCTYPETEYGSTTNGWCGSSHEGQQLFDDDSTAALNDNNVEGWSTSTDNWANDDESGRNGCAPAVDRTRDPSPALHCPHLALN